MKRAGNETLVMNWYCSQLLRNKFRIKVLVIHVSFVLYFDRQSGEDLQEKRMSKKKMKKKWRKRNLIPSLSPRSQQR